MVMSRFSLPSFEELLKRVRQPRLPSASDTATPEIDIQDTSLGFQPPPGFKVQGDGSLLSPRGITFKDFKLKDGKITSFQAFKGDKPIRLPSQRPAPLTSDVVTPDRPFPGLKPLADQPLDVRPPPVQPLEPVGQLFDEAPPISPVSDVVTAPFPGQEQARRVDIPRPEPPEPPRESVFETIRKAWTISSVRGVETTVQAFLNIIPELLIPDPVPISERSPAAQAELQDPRIRAQVERQMEISQSIKDAARRKATESLAGYKRWVAQHPELAPDPKFTEGAFKNPELWKDPNWWGYAIGNMAPQAATAVSAGALATMATGGNIFAGATAAGLTFAPLEAQGVFDDLIDEGIPRDQAAELAAVVTVPIVLVESASTFLQFLRFMPQIRQIFRQTATREIIKLTKRALVKKGLTTFTTLQFTETMEEVVQQALGNTAVIMAGKDRKLFAGVPEMLPEVTAGVAPFSLIGAGASTLTIPSSLTRPVTVPEGVREAVREERGAITLPGGEEQPTVESVAAKITANQVLTPAERQFYANQSQEVEAAIAQPAAQVAPEVTPTPEQAVTPTIGAEVAPLTQALVTDAEQIVTQAEAIQPDNPQVQEMRRLVDEAKTLTGDALFESLIQIEALEDEVKGIAGITEVSTERVVPRVTPQTLPVAEVSKLETRIPLDLIRKDEAAGIARLTEEIQAEGIKEPIVIRIRDDGSQIVWDGMHRLIVAQDLGLENIPVRFIGGEGETPAILPTTPLPPTPPVTKPSPKPAKAKISPVKKEVVAKAVEVVKPTPAVTEPQKATKKVEAIQKSKEPENVPAEEAKVAHIELAAPDGPKPPKPPTKTKAEKEADDIFKEITEKGFNERADQTLLRLLEGKLGAENTRTNLIVKSGGEKLKEQDIGVWKRDHLIPTPKDKEVLVRELGIALHNPSGVASGEVKVPAGFEEIYKELRELADWDTASRLDADPKAMTIDDWFFRGWKPPKDMFIGSGGRLAVKPKALRTPRVDATYEEMLDLGFEPLFWNPYEQWAYRHNLGVKYREQMELVRYLKGMGEELIRPHDGGPIPTGWRVPEVGPAFEGKPFAIKDPDTGGLGVHYSRRWITTNKIAGSLENIYGKKPDLGKFVIRGREIDKLAIIDAITFIPKRAKLFGSFFQQVDFLTRAGANSWAKAVDDLAAGKPVEAVKSLAKYPKAAGEILQANFSPTARRKLAEYVNDTTPLIEGRPGINPKAIIEAGLSTFDPTIFPEDMDKLVHQVAEETGVLSKGKTIVRAIGDLESAMRRGLFQGTYPAAMWTSIKNNIAPMTVRQHPSLNDAQINSMIAREANMLFSTIPASQSVIQGRILREILRRVFFSVGESEGLLRQASNALHGPNKRFWAKHWLGVYLFLATTMTIIHFASTGELPPLKRFTPIAKDKWGPLPFGYNTEFASPTIPIKGRGGAGLTLDLAGQMDTA
ncbi:hypothetical protein LCGC14_1226350, partial [marine sediment metagenome]